MKRIKIGNIKGHTKSVYLEKHSWDCEWYWGFGYLEARDMHFHFSEVVPNQSGGKELVFDFGCDDKTVIELEPGLDGWILMELFQQAYALKNVAEMYHTGCAGADMLSNMGIGSYRSKESNKKIAKKVNAELKRVLDDVWEYVITAVENN